MRTTFRIRQPYADIFLDCANQAICNRPVRPTRFIEKMKTNQGSIGMITGYGMDEQGLERKNPVIVALGDSVTAGHFESLLPSDPIKLQELIAQAMAAKQNTANSDQPVRSMAIEITDTRESYVEKFRQMLIDQYELTSVSAINAGIAGDNLIQMVARSDRDVIRYQPDLVIINGSLNWDVNMGTTEFYKELLAGLVRKIKAETEADIILLTPNGDLPNTAFNPDAPAPTTSERARAIREVSVEEQVCLADVYAVWETARNAGCPWEELLSNRSNHPSVEGHEVYAITLMKLFDE